MLPDDFETIEKNCNLYREAFLQVICAAPFGTDPKTIAAALAMALGQVCAAADVPVNEALFDVIRKTYEVRRKQ